MRILMFGWEYPPYITGGLGIACHGLTRALARYDFDITLILPKYDKTNVIPQKNIRILECSNLAKLHPIFNSVIHSHSSSEILNPYETSKNYLENIEVIKKILNKDHSFHWQTFTGKYDNNLFLQVLNFAKIGSQLAKNIDHDIIHAHDWLSILAGIFLKEISKKPLVLHIHSLEPDRNISINSFTYAIEKYGMQQANRIVAVSHYTKKMIQKYYGIDGAKIDVVHNGIDEHFPVINKSTNQKNFKIVLFLGRITHQKGTEYFISAANKVLQHRKDVKFVIAGVGDQIKQMIEYVAWLKQGKNILFVGFLNLEKVKYMYSLSDIYVMPSTSEPFGLTCLEALRNQIPVIISKQSGVSEVIKHAFKVDFWDVNEMASKIIALLDYPVIKKEQMNHVNQEIQSLNWDVSAKKLMLIYEKMMR